MIPLTVTAHLERGFSASDRWSPALESIIAAMQLQEKIGWQQYALEQSQNKATSFTDLSIQKVNADSELWWYACSMPEFESSYEITHAFFKRFDISNCLLIDKKVKTIELTKGQLKNYALSFKEVITKQVTWHCIGDKAEIERLLNHCQQIGSQRGKGLGFVTRWEIKEDGDMQKAMFNRAIPAKYAEKNGISGVKMWRGFRPCFRTVENKALCVMPF